MSIKVEQRSITEPSGVQTTVTATASSAASGSSKISMFKAKSGFVIPKNKLSGSLVPIFRGIKKSGGNDAVKEDSAKEVQRKTKWGPDLTQDPAVRKGRALAYQIKEYPGYNFIGIIFDPASDTQKRLEKETGAKIRVCGTKVKGERVEITSSDGNEAQGDFEELYVQISADTYEKVDAAVALIEMVVTPVSVNQSAVSTTSTSVCTENATVLEQSQGTSTNREQANSIMGSVQAPQAQFQPYPGPWFPMGPPQTPSRPPSGFVLPPNPNPVQPSSSPFNPSQNMPSLFGPRPFPSQHPSMVFSGPQPPVMQRPFMVQQPPFGQYGPPRNPQPGVSAPPPFMGNQPSSTGQPPIGRPLGPSLSQPMPIPNSGSLPSLGPSQGFRPMTSQPISAAGGPPSNISTVNMVSPRPMQTLSPIPPPQLFMSRAPTPNPTPNPLFGSNHPIGPPVASLSTPPPPSPGGIPSSASGNASSFTPIKPHPISGDFTFQPHWSHTSASQSVPRPGTQPLIQNMRPINPIAPPPQPPKTPTFRPVTHPSSPQPNMQGIISRPQLSNQMNPFGGNPTTTSAPLRNPGFPNPTPMPPNSLVPRMGLRNLNPTPFPPRPGTPLLPPNFQAAGGRPQNLLLAPNQQRGGPGFRPGSQQIYDPFSPTSVPAVAIQGGDLGKIRMHESDPEYEDLMASVGVK